MAKTVGLTFKPVKKPEEPQKPEGEKTDTEK